MRASSSSCIAFVFLIGVSPVVGVVNEPPDFPSQQPGPRVVRDAATCMRVASGAIAPGDMDWVQVAMPFSSLKTVVDVDITSTTGRSTLLAAVVGGRTGFNSADNNNTADNRCGSGAGSSPVGSLQDSAVDLLATSAGAIINVGVSGAGDTGFTGNHTQTFSYDIWVYAEPDQPDCVADADCDDGRLCNGLEACVGSLCVAGPPPSCDDGIDCTIDSCHVATDQCRHAPDHSDCDDGVYCNGEEICDVEIGCRTEPFECPWDLPVCVEEFADCVECAADADCDDGVFCNGAERCVDYGCAPGSPPACDDGVDCTADACDEILDRCVSSADDVACDDGVFCNGVERCDVATGCRSGMPVTCDDGVDCTVDRCDNGVDDCVFTANDEACDDGNACNGVELCDMDAGCVGGPVPDCDDGVECTVDMCDEVTGECAHVADDGLCDDELYCNGVEVCDPTSGCVTGEPPPCDDGVDCTVDYCDEGRQQCRSKPDDEYCNDGNFCNGRERCDRNLGCVPGQPRCPERKPTSPR